MSELVVNPVDKFSRDATQIEQLYPYVNNKIAGRGPVVQSIVSLKTS